MLDLFLLTLGCVGILSLLKEGQTDATVYGEGAFYDRPSYAISGYDDDGQIRQSRRRARERERRTDLFFFHCTGASSFIPFP
jgi:hypothetical protein